VGATPPAGAAYNVRVQAGIEVRDVDEPERGAVRGVLLPVVLPLALVVAILVADWLEGPKTAFVGVLTAIPFLAAVFATPRVTALVSLLTWLAALGFGFVASDGNVQAQRTRLIFIALAGVGAVLAARRRARQEVDLVAAERQRLQLDQARRDASTDVLTGLLNRRGLTASLEALEHKGEWTLAIIDVDDFKAVNDAHGHAAGDEYLTALAVRLTRSLADGDHVGRWGGDEFLVALSLPPREAYSVLRRVHAQVTRDAVPSSAGPLRLKMTIGAAGWHPGQPFTRALREADAALFEGKRRGENEVVRAEVDGFV